MQVQLLSAGTKKERKSLMKKTAKNRKSLWQIDLNWYGENHRFFRYAKERDFVLSLGIMALAKKLNLRWRVVSNYIQDGFDRYAVVKVKK